MSINKVWRLIRHPIKSFNRLFPPPPDGVLRGRDANVFVLRMERDTARAEVRELAARIGFLEGGQDFLNTVIEEKDKRLTILWELVQDEGGVHPIECDDWFDSDGNVK